MTYPLAYTGASGITPSDTEFPTGLSLPQVSLYDVKARLRKLNNSTDDDDLTGYLLGAQNRIAQACVPLAPTPVVDTFDGVTGTGTLVLSTAPVSSITSVTVFGYGGTSTVIPEAGGSTGLLDGYRKNLGAGTVRRVGYRTWPTGWGNIQVSYTAGPTQTPVEVVLAVVLTVEVWWESRRLSGNLRAPGGTNAEPGDAPEPMFGVPADAYDLLLNWLKPPRVA